MQSLSPAWYYSAVTAFFILSLAVNALVTAMIVYKIITVYHDIREFNDSNVQLQASAYRNGRRDIYYPLISILIGSGLITVFGQLAQSIMYKVSQVAFPLVGGSVVMLYVRVFFFCRLFKLIWWYFSSTYLLYTGNFFDSCPCAHRDWHFLRS